MDEPKPEALSLERLIIRLNFINPEDLKYLGGLRSGLPALESISESQYYPHLGDKPVEVRRLARDLQFLFDETVQQYAVPFDLAPLEQALNRRAKTQIAVDYNPRDRCATAIFKEGIYRLVVNLQPRRPFGTKVSFRGALVEPTHKLPLLLDFLEGYAKLVIRNFGGKEIPYPIIPANDTKYISTRKLGEGPYTARLQLLKP